MKTGLSRRNGLARHWRWVALSGAVALALVLVGCTAGAAPSRSAQSSPPAEAEVRLKPLLPVGLRSDCPANPTANRTGKRGFAAGETAVDFTLKDLDGKPVTLSDLLAEKPVMLEFGSFT